MRRRCPSCRCTAAAKNWVPGWSTRSRKTSVYAEVYEGRVPTVRYPVRLEEDDNNTILVTFPDFPEAHTFGDTKDEALEHAVDALETIIDAYIRDRRPIPAPSKLQGNSIALPALMRTKVQLYEAMRTQHVGKAELARRLNVHLPQVDRLLNLKHGSKLDQLEAAAQALGGELDVSVAFRKPAQVGSAFLAHKLPAGARARITARLRSSRRMARKRQ